jgi:hypothetical protein
MHEAVVYPQRVLRNTEPTLTFAITSDGDPADADAPPTVDVLREDGTSLVDDAATTAGQAGDGLYTYPLAAANTAQLDALTVRLNATINGDAHRFDFIVEVAGGHLFTIAEARSLDPLGDEATYPLEDILAARIAVEAALEDACGVAFVPRYARAKLDGNGKTDLLLPNVEPRALIAVTVDGTALDSGELAEVELLEEGVLYRAAGWAEGRRNVEVKYEHGFSRVPGRVNRAALQLARHVLVDSPISDRTTSLTTEDGTVQVFVTPGVRGAVFAIPEANAVVVQYGMGPAVA